MVSLLKLLLAVSMFLMSYAAETSKPAAVATFPTFTAERLESVNQFLTSLKRHLVTLNAEQFKAKQDAEIANVFLPPDAVWLIKGSSVYQTTPLLQQYYAANPAFSPNPPNNLQTFPPRSQEQIDNLMRSLEAMIPKMTDEEKTMKQQELSIILTTDDIKMIEQSKVYISSIVLQQFLTSITSSNTTREPSQPPMTQEQIDDFMRLIELAIPMMDDENKSRKELEHLTAADWEMIKQSPVYLGSLDLQKFLAPIMPSNTTRPPYQTPPPITQESVDTKNKVILDNLAVWTPEQKKSVQDTLSAAWWPDEHIAMVKRSPIYINSKALQEFYKPIFEAAANRPPITKEVVDKQLQQLEAILKSSTKEEIKQIEDYYSKVQFYSPAVEMIKLSSVYQNSQILKDFYAAIPPFNTSHPTKTPWTTKGQDTLPLGLCTDCFNLCTSVYHDQADTFKKCEPLCQKSCQSKQPPPPPKTTKAPPPPPRTTYNPWTTNGQATPQEKVNELLRELQTQLAAASPIIVKILQSTLPTFFPIEYIMLVKSSPAYQNSIILQKFFQPIFDAIDSPWTTKSKVSPQEKVDEFLQEVLAKLAIAPPGVKKLIQMAAEKFVTDENVAMIKNSRVYQNSFLLMNFFTPIFQKIQKDFNLPLGLCTDCFNLCSCVSEGDWKLCELLCGDECKPKYIPPPRTTPNNGPRTTGSRPRTSGKPQTTWTQSAIDTALDELVKKLADKELSDAEKRKILEEYDDPAVMELVKKSPAYQNSAALQAFMSSNFKEATAKVETQSTGDPGLVAGLVIVGIVVIVLVVVVVMQCSKNRKLTREATVNIGADYETLSTNV